MTFPAQNAKRHPPKKMSFFVRTVRLELTQANAHYPLKVACLPFHHVRNTLGLQSYELFHKNKIFFEIFLCIFVELFRKTAKLRRQFIGTHCVTV